MPSGRISDWAIFRRVLAQVRPFALRLAGIFVLDLLATPLALLVPVPLKIAVDHVIGSEPLPEILAPLMAQFGSPSKGKILLGAVLLQVAVVLLTQLQWMLAYVQRTQVGEGMTLGFRARLFHQVQRLSLLFHDLRGTSDSVYRIQYDAPSIQWITIYGFMPFISALLMLLSMFYVIFRLNWHLALMALTILPPLYVYARYYNNRMRPRYTETRELESSALHVIQEVLTAIRVVKAFGREDHEEERFLSQSRANVRAKTRLAAAEGGFGLLVNVTIGIGSSLVLLLGVWGVQSGRISVGELLMVITYLAQFYAPVETISKQVAEFQSSLAGAQRAFELLDEVPEVSQKPNPQRLSRASGAVEFRGVSFSYDRENPVLKNISFSVPPGSRVGIQGRTGAGKTTLVSLLFRLYDPQSGEVLLDGRDLRDYHLPDLRTQFALMLQEPVLFSTSIAENIAYARPGATMKEIAAAAEAANAQGFILDLPEGYQTLVGERGMRLSGGERQRISLARAFLRDAPILILDEPTSSIDLATEAGVFEGIECLMKGRTTFIIAHRPSTLRSCDRLLTLDGGEIVHFTSGPPLPSQSPVRQDFLETPDVVWGIGHG